MLSGREYNLFHESSMELKLGEEYESLPDSCKHCKQLNYFNGCKLSDNEIEENECPLESIFCKDCQYYCTIHNQEDEVFDYGFCSLEVVALDTDNMACHEFVRFEKEGGGK